MKVLMNKPTEVNIKTMHVFLKVRDEFSAIFKDVSGIQIKEYEGYVPDFMPGEHFGDYVDLEIDLDSGLITNWKTIDPIRFAKFINRDDN